MLNFFHFTVCCIFLFSLGSQIQEWQQISGQFLFSKHWFLGLLETLYAYDVQT